MASVNLSPDEEAWIDAYRDLKAKKALRDTATKKAADEDKTARQAVAAVEAAADLLRRMTQG